jgi:hypothetical protein
MVKFSYEFIVVQFGCPFHIITNQGTHFINDVIRYLIKLFLIHHTNSTIYYPQGNGQAMSTNKVINTLLTKLVDEK